MVYAKDNAYYHRYWALKIVICNPFDIVVSTVQDPAYVVKEVFVYKVPPAGTPIKVPIDLTWFSTTDTDCIVWKAVLIPHASVISDGFNIETTSAVKSTEATYNLQFTLTAGS